MGESGFYEYVSRIATGGYEKDDMKRCLDLSEEGMDVIIATVETWSVDDQMEYMRILENRFLQTQPILISKMGMKMILSEKMDPLVRLETVRWWLDESGRDRVHFTDTLLPLLEHCWENHRKRVGISYLLNFIASTAEDMMQPVEKRSALLPLLESIIVSPDASEDFRYHAMLGTRQYLDRTDFTTLIRRLWDRRIVFTTTTWLLLIQYIAAHPTRIDSVLFPRDEMMKFLGEQLTMSETAPWDRADAALIVLNMNAPGYEDLASTAQTILHDDYEFGADHPRPFYQNPENVHCISLDSAQEILDFLHQEYPMHPHHDMSYYDDWIMECLRIWPQTETDVSKIWTSMCRISKDYSVHGRHRDRLINILRLIVCFIEKDKENGKELRRRLLEELIDMSGTCSTGFAVRLLNVLSGYNDFSIQIPPEHALRCRFFLHLNKAMMGIADEEYRGLVMDELTLPSSHYSDRIHFLTFFAEQLPHIKESLYNDFRDSMTDTDFDFFLRKCIYHYEGGQGEL